MVEETILERITMGVNILETLGGNVRRLRRARGLTQKELAAQIGLSLASISRIEEGKKGVSLDVLRRLVEFFGVSYNTLLQEHDDVGDLSTIEFLLSGKSPEYVKQIENIIAACGRLPRE